MDHPLPDFVIGGPQKCATTWLYDCFREHPDILVPETDSVAYFNMHFNKSESWYRSHFSQYDGETVVGEESPTYIRDPVVPERMAELLPEAKLLFVLRNPIDRAFSHYWHEKGKNKITFEFKEVLENYDLFQNWVVPGLYHRHIERFYEHFPEENIKLLFFEDLVADDRGFLSEAYEFVGVDSTFEPSYLSSKVNTGEEKSIRSRAVYRKAVDGFTTYAPEGAIDAVKPVHDSVMSVLASQTEYDRGMRPEDRRRLEELLIDDFVELNAWLDRDIDHWLEYESL